MISLGVFYWFMWFVGLFFGPAGYYPTAPAPGWTVWRPFGGMLFIWIMLFIIGWKVFGWPVGG